MNDRPGLQRRKTNEHARIARQRSRERQKLLGVLLILLLILIFAFVRFGKTIPWGAR